MKTSSWTWTPTGGLSPAPSAEQSAQLALYFGPRAMLEDPACYDDLRAAFPKAILLGCSSGGHIVGEDICDDRVSVATVAFRDARLKGVSVCVPDASRSRPAGEEIAANLDAPDLVAVIALSDGLNVNGNQLIAGMTSRFGRDVPICGGMAGDGANFQRTLAGLNCAPVERVVGAVGLYGDSLKVGWGAAGGWRAFGPPRVVSRANGSVLEELDGRPALDVYTRYLDAEDVAALPNAALQFPLMVRNPVGREEDLVRTVLDVDRASGTMTFAGEIPRGWKAQLLRGNITSMTRGAEDAGAMAVEPIAEFGDVGADGLALLVSCIARRLTMGAHSPYEIDAVHTQLPKGMCMAGFYSYGGFAPHARTRSNALHNQTMAVLTVVEASA